MFKRFATLFVMLLVLAVNASAATRQEPADARFARAGRLMQAGKLEDAYALLEVLAREHPARWGKRAGKRMAEITTLVESRDSARQQSARLRTASEGAQGAYKSWLLLESARILVEARLFPEAAVDAEASAAVNTKRFRSPALLLAARCRRQSGKRKGALKNYRAVLAEAKAARKQRAAAWRELESMLSQDDDRGDLVKVLFEHVQRGVDEPGAAEAVNMCLSISMVDHDGAVLAAGLLKKVLEKWPGDSIQPEWLLTAGKLAEFIQRDYVQASKYYAAVIADYPESCFDLGKLKMGIDGADAGRKVVQAAMARVKAKSGGQSVPLKAPPAGERGKTPEQALAAVLCALRQGNTKIAAGCASGLFAEEIEVKLYPFRQYALSDYRITGRLKEKAGQVTLGYQVSGELGVTRILKKKAVMVSDGVNWKVSVLGM
jgi:tetratricopeptide (TPR) repeat protein